METKKRQYTMEDKIYLTNKTIESFMKVGKHRRKNVPEFVLEDIEKYRKYFHEDGRLKTSYVRTKKEQKDFIQVMNNLSYLRGYKTLGKNEPLLRREITNKEGQVTRRLGGTSKQALRAIEVFTNMTRSNVTYLGNLNSDVQLSLATNRDYSKFSPKDITILAEKLYNNEIANLPKEARKLIDDNDFLNRMNKLLEYAANNGIKNLDYDTIIEALEPKEDKKEDKK